MFSTNIDKSQYLLGYSRNWGWLLAWGIVFIILGILAISVATFTTLLSVVFLGAILIISGIVAIIDSFKTWWGKWNGFIIHLLIGIFYVLVGAMLINNPVMSSLALTFLLGILYLVLGIFRIIYSAALRLPWWGWSLFNGIISLLIGILILISWPASGLVIIGLFVGIDLLVAGWVYVMWALAGKRFL